MPQENVPITPGTGANIAADNVGDVYYQEVKLDGGVAGTSIPIVAGQHPMAQSLPMAPASDANLALEAGGNLAQILVQLVAGIQVTQADMSLALRMIYEQLVNPISQDPLTGRTRVSLDAVPSLPTATLGAVSTVITMNILKQLGSANNDASNLPPDIATVAFATRFRGRII